MEGGKSEESLRQNRYNAAITAAIQPIIDSKEWTNFNTIVAETQGMFGIVRGLGALTSVIKSPNAWEAGLVVLKNTLAYKFLPWTFRR